MPKSLRELAFALGDHVSGCDECVVCTDPDRPQIHTCFRGDMIVSAFILTYKDTVKANFIRRDGLDLLLSFYRMWERQRRSDLLAVEATDAVADLLKKVFKD